MKQLLINALKVDQLSKLSIKEKGNAINELRAKFKLSYQSIANMTGYNKTTLIDWATGRQKHAPGCLHVSITQLIKHFKIYEPKTLIEWSSLIQLSKVLEDRIKKDSPKAKLDKTLGWEE